MVRLQTGRILCKADRQIADTGQPLKPLTVKVEMLKIIFKFQRAEARDNPNGSELERVFHLSRAGAGKKLEHILLAESRSLLAVVVPSTDRSA